MFKVFPDVAIHSIATCVPQDERLNTRFFQQFGEEQMTRLIESTGVQKTRWSAPNEMASDLCFNAATHLMSQEKIDSNSIDALIFACNMPDELVPPTSHRLQFRLGLTQNTFCYDLTFGCSGYVMGITHASMMIHSGIANRVLVLSGETPTKLLNPDDRSTLPLFGDAGSASLIERRNGSQISCSAFSDGSGADAILSRHSGFRRQPDEASYMKMNGTDVFIFATREVPRSVEYHLNQIQIKKEDINLFCLHQANILIVNSIAKKLKISDDLLLNSISEYGNTGSSSIPLSICYNEKKIQNKKKKNVLLSGFGVGLSWGNVMCDLTDTHVYPTIISNG